MFRLFVVIIFLTVTSNVAADISHSEYMQCKSISDSLKRLVCYDELDNNLVTRTHSEQSVELNINKAEQLNNRSAESQVNQNPLITASQWQVSIDKNQRDLSKSRATARLDAIANIPEDLKPQLVVHCNSKSTSLYIDWNTEIGRVNKYIVYIDENRFTTPRWNTSKNKQLTYYPRKVMGMMREMFGATKLTVEIELKNTASLKAEFDITGITEAVEPIRYACDW